MKGKKLVAALLAGVCVLSMTACGGKTAETTTTTDTTAQEETTDEAAGKGYKIGFSLMTVSDAVMAQTIQDAVEYISSIGGELLADLGGPGPQSTGVLHGRILDAHGVHTDTGHLVLHHRTVLSQSHDTG